VLYIYSVAVECPTARRAAPPPVAGVATDNGALALYDRRVVGAEPGAVLGPPDRLLSAAASLEPANGPCSASISLRFIGLLFLLVRRGQPTNSDLQHRSWASMDGP